MSNPVLCAVDVSDGLEDLNVVKQAKRLADLDNVQLDVITVLPDYGMSIVGGFFEQDHHERAIDEAKSRLNALVIAALGEKDNVDVRHVVATGKTYAEILNTAKAQGAGLIVIGAHKPDLKDYLLGPNAARVVRHSDCSVLVVR
ncbi:MAG: universal stress protein [Rhodobacteraceae bacterium]|nr:universal stress protein [Paracoccaceae bacterium]